ncbi:glycine/D-amino acid oxidase-like deaminating enzyme [Nonomuraea polychroma]|uniref:Glycine/D-amino acid oxidase-like deaminating enzyme n=1 Tax=Nonomuraea polychroma TaxID=46176 RepID=A0A438M401_9ACTN|nr:FAD-dependent oxidoreductase [Nonomuraea polychroma]RVX40535.1 glycine/D-amino acid oxidase-like deaminating enzyme [Nonomuraea polychroma]
MRVVVIGSGIVGAGAAYYLSGRGADVTVVDGGYQGEATQAGAGIVCPWVDHPEDDAWYRLTREGARHYPDLVETLGEDIGYAEVGALLVAEDPADLEPVRALLRRRYPEAPEMGHITDVAAPAELFPPLSDTLSALLVPGAARVDGCSVRDALLAAAIARGAEVRTGAARLTPDGEVLVHALAGAAPGEPSPPAAPLQPLGERTPPTRQQPGVSGETTSWRQAAPLTPSAPPPATMGSARRFAGESTPLDADMVIVAAGAWTGEVCRPLGVELPVFPRRGQILHVTLEGVDTAWWPIVLPSAGPYLLGFSDSRVLIGATVEDVGFAPRVTMGGLDELIEAGLRVAPGLFGASVTETRVGLRPVYAPGPALIGRLTGRVVVATGLSAYGLTAGPFTGRIAAALALGEEPPIDVTPYAPPRV